MDGCIFCLFWIYITFQVLSLLSLNFFVIHRHLELSLLDISLFLSRRPSLLLFLSHSLLSGHIISISILFSCPSNYPISASHNVNRLDLFISVPGSMYSINTFPCSFQFPSSSLTLWNLMEQAVVEFGKITARPSSQY